MSDYINLFDSIRSKVNNALENFYIPETPKSLYDPLRYVIRGEGKRLRPILLHLTARAFKVEHKSLMDASIAVELLHNFTLVHDDIMDDDDMRHGKGTVHNKWDEATAILVGDALFSYAQISIAKFSDNLKTYQTFNKTMIEICEGQALDLEYQYRDKVTIDEYIGMIDKKTGYIIGMCSEIGSMLCNYSVEDQLNDEFSNIQEEAIKKYGTKFTNEEFYSLPKSNTKKKFLLTNFPYELLLLLRL